VGENVNQRRNLAVALLARQLCVLLLGVAAREDREARLPLLGADARGPDAERVADRLDEVVLIDVDRDQELAFEIGRANPLQGRAAQDAQAGVGVLRQPSLKCGVGLTTSVPAGGRGARGAWADGHRIEA